MKHLGVQPVNEDVARYIDSGDLYLTSKRLMLLGAGNTAIQLKRIIDSFAYRNGIRIDKDSGKPLFLQFDGDIEMVSMMFKRAMHDLD